MNWLNEPASWRADGATLTVTADAQTDFWRKTHDGGARDSGHFYGQRVEGDFVAEVKVSGQYRDLYDHAGLMARLDEATWLKCGVEFVEGVQYASAVVTRDFSDWSICPLAGSPESLWLRVNRHGGTIEVRYSLDGQTYTLLRQATLTTEPVHVGVMIAAPKGNGFTARFEGLTVG